MAALRADGGRQPDHRRQPQAVVAGGQHHLAGADFSAGGRHAEAAVAVVDALHPMVREICHAQHADALVQRPQQPQRVAMAVERAIGAADHVGSDERQLLAQRLAVHHLVGVADHVGLVVQPHQGVGAGLQILFRQHRHEAAGPPEGDVDAGLLAQQVGEAAPQVGGLLGPAGIFRHPQPLALHPDQGEVAARRPHGDIALVQHRDLPARPGETPGQRRPDQPAADHGDVILSAPTGLSHRLHSRGRFPAMSLAHRPPPFS